MPTDCIPFRETHYFSSLICDYLDEKQHLQPFYNRFPKLENFKAQIEEKGSSVRVQSRTVLVESLKNQYKGFDISDLTSKHIESLKQDNTFTITTGHQVYSFDLAPSCDPLPPPNLQKLHYRLVFERIFVEKQSKP